LKIFLINPNSDPGMTEAILRSAEAYARDDFEVVCRRNPEAPRFIETYEDEIRTAPGMIKMVRENQGEFDAFVVACHCDPNLDALKEVSQKPVVGIGEASMRLAAMLGHRFSVISAGRHSIPNKQALVRKYHMEGLLASVRCPVRDLMDTPEEEQMLDAARSALRDDGAEVIVLGCAGQAGMDARLHRELGAPVLDGVACALIVASGLVRAGLAISKVRRYNPGV